MIGIPKFDWMIDTNELGPASKAVLIRLKVPTCEASTPAEIIVSRGIERIWTEPEAGSRCQIMSTSERCPDTWPAPAWAAS